jgi:hypothetical protein
MLTTVSNNQLLFETNLKSFGRLGIPNCTIGSINNLTMCMILRQQCISIHINVLYIHLLTVLCHLKKQTLAELRNKTIPQKLETNSYSLIH